MNNITLVDTHVHYYKFCDFAEFFDSAYKNVKDTADHLGASSFTSILCLLETGGSQWYQSLLSLAESDSSVAKWSVRTIDDNQTLLITKNAGEKLLVLPGKQIITSENLEVIIVGVRDEVPNNMEIEFYLDEYTDQYLVILPWGVGKWLGERGRMISNIIMNNADVPFVLGDNSGRPALWNRIPQFQLAKSLGINILPGSDPLPISGQQKKVACFGSVIQGAIGQNEIQKQIRNKLLYGKGELLKTYGKLDSLFGFLSSQILLRIRPIR